MFKAIQRRLHEIDKDLGISAFESSARLLAHRLHWPARQNHPAFPTTSQDFATGAALVGQALSPGVLSMTCMQGVKVPHGP